MPKPQSLISALLPPCLGLSLLFCFAASPPQKHAPFSSADAGQGCQPKPASDNATRLILLRCQYREYGWCRRQLRLAPAGPEAVRWRRNTREAVLLYNQVAGDTDPSAFALTSLPRRLTHD